MKLALSQGVSKSRPGRPAARQPCVKRRASASGTPGGGDHDPSAAVAASQGRVQLISDENTLSQLAERALNATTEVHVATDEDDRASRGHTRPPDTTADPPEWLPGHRERRERRPRLRRNERSGLNVPDARHGPAVLLDDHRPCGGTRY